MKIKICGLCRKEDIDHAISEGADYIGIILYEKSPRYVDPEKAISLIKDIKNAKRVAVMVNPDINMAVDMLRKGFDFIQLHGNEDYEFAEQIGIERVIKAFRIKEETPKIEKVWKKAHAILLDTYRKDSYGGTGQTFDWNIARQIREKDFRVFLSGGLNPSNVIHAIEKVKPFGVDVSSGVELKPCMKDKKLLSEFIRKVKELKDD